MIDDTTTGDGPEEAAHSAPEAFDLIWLAPDGSARRVSLLRTVTLGRDEACDLCIPTSATSREHARISRSGSFLTIQDLASKNGVFVDGRRVESSPLKRGSVLRVGGGIGVVAVAQLDGDGDFAEIAEGLFGGKHLASVARRARLAAKSGLHIVLEAESGSGKELFARAVHAWSGRTGALVPINCSALPINLAEAELFGYQRGAFTGAERSHGGYFRGATGGTLFLDEILDLPLEIQAKILRAVEQREVVPLGASQAQRVDTRIVAASQIPLAEAVRSGRMRPDLFARLNGVTIQIPPLRERREDILPLFSHFVLRHAQATAPKLDPAAAEALCLHDWPLNVRELETVAQRLVVLHPGEEHIGVKQIAALLGHLPMRAEHQAQALVDSDETWQGLIEALADKKGNVVRAAETLGISRQRAYRLIARHPEFDVSSLRRVRRCN